MCGIFGQLTFNIQSKSHLRTLSDYSRRRGVDSSGFVYFDDGYHVLRANYDIRKLLSESEYGKPTIAMGHSRLVTNGLNDNQPVIRDGIIVIHNGIITNEQEIWGKINKSREFQIDSEAINVIVDRFLEENDQVLSDDIFSWLNETLKGTVSTAIAIPSIGKLLLYSNNGSLYYYQSQEDVIFSSESYPLKKINGLKPIRLLNEGMIFDIPRSKNIFFDKDSLIRDEDLIPTLRHDVVEEKMLEYHHHDLKRCTRCILPETMPFIEFDQDGVCNYCNHAKPLNVKKSKEELLKLVTPYKGKGDYDCLVPFSGGRDSCYSLHIIVKEMGLKPLTFTYDWGMVTDLARRNISRMCQQLGLENIVIAADISKKRDNIRMNLKAWLKYPDLGMVNIFTAGDKHFFKYNEIVKKENDIELELWGINQLETTHFKSGFLGMKPDLNLTMVYNSGLQKQLDYHSKRFKAMVKSPGYFNSSLFDTLSGEYYRSLRKRGNYFHLYNYWQWEEQEVNNTLASYGFEKAPDTNTTWRIGDGTAAFYNYIYYTVAGFTEHDTFRSNQIREGQLTREKALELVADENRPRYQNIRWYLDALNMDFKEVIQTINSIPKMYQPKP